MNDVRIDVRLTADDLVEALAADVREGLTSSPKWLPPKWFYDERGSLLFDDITRLPEYYPTRREKEILSAAAGQIAEATGARTLAELGSGTSEKTRWLLDALRTAGTLRRFVPFDVDETTLLRAGRAIANEYPGVDVCAVCGDFERHLAAIPAAAAQAGPVLVAFLGGTIGNLQPSQRKTFFMDVRAGLGEGDALLLGTDLVKDTKRLVAAYDDSAGVTAQFNLNVLRVLNRELRADADLAGFEHRARFDPDEEWIEMHLVSRRAQVVTIGALDLAVEFAAGESVRTEVSAKFRRERVESELAAAGLRLVRWWTDRAGDYALSLAVPV